MPVRREFRSQMSYGKWLEKTDRNTKVRERRIPLAKKREAKQLQAQVGDHEQPERLKEAELLWQLVLSWGEKCATVRIFNELSEYRQKEFRALRTTKFAQYDHHGLTAHRRAYLAWAEWCKSEFEVEDPLVPTVIAFPKWLEARTYGVYNTQ